MEKGYGSYEGECSQRLLEGSRLNRASRLKQDMRGHQSKGRNKRPVIGQKNRLSKMAEVIKGREAGGREEDAKPLGGRGLG